MEIQDLERFQKIEEAWGSRYLAVKFIALVARRWGSEGRAYKISESKLIDWVLTGKCPYSHSKLETRKYISERIDDLNEKLCEVLDPVVVDEVKHCYKQSIKNKRLTYTTRTDISPYVVSRINILLRMIWFSFSTEGEE